MKGEGLIAATFCIQGVISVKETLKQRYRIVVMRIPEAEVPKQSVG